jgi:apolipoprotein N-acyltransferase
VALVPLLVRWAQAESAQHLLVEAYGCFLLACSIAFYWVVRHPIPNAAMASLGGLLIFPMLLSLPVGAAFLVRKRWGLGQGLTAFVAFYLLMEWGLHHGPLAFPWPLLAHTQATFDPFRQVVDLSGPSALTGWLLLINSSVAVALLTPQRGIRWSALLGAGLLLAGAALYGWHRLEQPVDSDGATSALLVQPALPPLTWADVDSPARVDTLLRMSNAALDTSTSVDLVIWPETAVYLPADSATRHDRIKRLQTWSQQRRIVLLAGAIATTPAIHSAGMMYYNTAFLVDSSSVQRYRKNYLVPFAEHVPFSEYVPRLRALSVPAGGVAGYGRGQSQPPLVARSFRTGVLICFESLFTPYVLSYVRPASTSRAVDFLVTVAQDGWWGPSPGYQQHMAFSQLRAIATRRAMAFVTVTGQTGLIDAYGQLSSNIGWMMRTARRVTIPHVTALSPYVRYGDWLSAWAALATAGFMLVGLAHYTLSKTH